jgi:hypothetical protein
LGVGGAGVAAWATRRAAAWASWRAAFGGAAVLPQCRQTPLVGARSCSHNPKPQQRPGPADRARAPTFEMGIPSPAMVRVAWDVMGLGRGMVSLRPSRVSTAASPPHSAVMSGTLTAGGLGGCSGSARRAVTGNAAGRVHAHALPGLRQAWACSGSTANCGGAPPRETTPRGQAARRNPQRRRAPHPWCAGRFRPA